MKELIDAMVNKMGNQEKVAEKLGITTNYIWRLYNGSRFPSAKMLKRIKFEFPELASLVDVVQLNRVR